MANLKDFYTTAAQLYEAPLLELSQHVLQVLGSKLQRPHDSECAHNFFLSVQADYDGCEQALIACSEAWSWLYSNGFICQHPNHEAQWISLTRLGKRHYEKAIPLKNWMADRLLPEEMIHPALQPMALRLYKQELFDTAVFEAFKLLEVSIRQAAGLGDEWLGTKLAARAFNPESGPLTDSAAEAGERQALMSLMCGAIGSYKNPQSHRHVGLDASEAREMIIMASHLLKIVDSRRPA
ncbi:MULTISPECIES: TIGR02391 family protein [unclassified Pseudomonas]|uniref:TIGR02391 family protein n=1 Tax=unclassified Pseudomonas TaxID=196821 RepID=UPI001AE3DBEE|nr:MULTISPECIES: TIGR02391 family protein [unclassified Pseudomonas]MBP2272929.1 uncharacterized protein (TIGR02391 family) [Pseudomonas sp. BP6]MBP2288099.1 uncharacterized protein (TIGR02391 family) [Pseudomonas sp. BP7]HDS1696173.1 TIGR02391 family protein [Pseudomonas putida]HDS1701270.1 TIGR02391 family protein [Pseudomonas putida]